MSKIFLFAFVVLSAGVIGLGAGCAVGSPTKDDAAQAQASQSRATDAGVADASAVVGVYASEPGEPRPFRVLILSKSATGSNTFVAYIDSAPENCDEGGCRPDARVSGTWEMQSRTIEFKPTLASPDAGPSQAERGIGGKFDVAVEGEQGARKLALRRGSFRETLTENPVAQTYCMEAANCDAQNVGHAECLGRFSCESNTCKWACVPSN